MMLGMIIKEFGEAKFLIKSNTFMWLLTNNAVLTRDNMVKRNWSGNPACQFCNLDESCDHLFFTCPIAKVVWAAVAKSIGASNIPDSLSQCWAWCEITGYLMARNITYGVSQLYAGQSGRRTIGPVLTGKLSGIRLRYSVMLQL
jgi:hypothetical protein